jgi:hypothetical protein
MSFAVRVKASTKGTLSNFSPSRRRMPPSVCYNKKYLRRYYNASTTKPYKYGARGYTHLMDLPNKITFNQFQLTKILIVTLEKNAPMAQEKKLPNINQPNIKSKVPFDPILNLVKFNLQGVPFSNFCCPQNAFPICQKIVKYEVSLHSFSQFLLPTKCISNRS